MTDKPDTPKETRSFEDVYLIQTARILELESKCADLIRTHKALMQMADEREAELRGQLAEAEARTADRCVDRLHEAAYELSSTIGESLMTATYRNAAKLLLALPLTESRSE